MSMEVYGIGPARRRQRTPTQQQQSAPHAALLFGGGGGGDPYWSSVTLLCHFDSASGTNPIYFVNQASGFGQVYTAGTTLTVSSTQYKFGGFSAKYPASVLGQWIKSIDAGCALGTGDGTVEFWIRCSSVAGVLVPYESRTVAGANGFVIYLPTGSGIIAWNNGADRAVSAAGTMVVNTWQHVAWSRAAGVSRLFVDGIQIGSNYTDAGNYSTTQINLGATANGSYAMVNAYFDEWRVTKGVGRYTANFTPPTAAFPDF